MDLKRSILGTEYTNGLIRVGFSGPIRKTQKFIINVFLTPIYNVFLSRGIHFEDRIIGDPIAQTISEWGCWPRTVGINVNVPENQVTSRIEKEIQECAGLIVVATPRILDYSTLTWRTLEWANSEAGMAYAKRKPILILKQKDVKLGGLLSRLDTQLLEFDPLNMYDLKIKLSVIMPGFRAAMEQGNTKEFNQKLKDLVMKGLAAVGGIVLISGIIGFFLDEE